MIFFIIHLPKSTQKVNIAFRNIQTIFAEVLWVFGCIYMSTVIFALFSGLLQGGLLKKHGGRIWSRLLFDIKLSVPPEISRPVDIILFKMRVTEHVLILGYILTHDVIIHREILLLCSITKNGLHQFFARGFDGVWLNFLDSSIRNCFFHLIIRFQALAKPIMTHGIITYITI